MCSTTCAMPDCGGASSAEPTPTHACAASTGAECPAATCKVSPLVTRCIATAPTRKLTSHPSAACSCAQYLRRGTFRDHKPRPPNLGYYWRMKRFLGLVALLVGCGGDPVDAEGTWTV